MWNARLDEAQAGIKIARRNINNLRYEHDTTWHYPNGRKRRGTEEPLDESERGEWKSWLETQHSENKDRGIQSLHFLANQFSSVSQLCLTFCNPVDWSTPGFPVHHQLPELAQAHVHLVSDAIQPSHPLSSPSPHALNLSQHQGLFKWVPLRIRCPKHWSFSFNISPTNEHPGLISFRMDWLDILTLRGTLKNLFQHHSSKASILRCSAFFIVPTPTSIHDLWKNHSLD